MPETCSGRLQSPDYMGGKSGPQEACSFFSLTTPKISDGNLTLWHNWPKDNIIVQYDYGLHESKELYLICECVHFEP